MPRCLFLRNHYENRGDIEGCMEHCKLCLRCAGENMLEHGAVAEAPHAECTQHPAHQHEDKHAGTVEKQMYEGFPLRIYAACDNLL